RERVIPPGRPYWNGFIESFHGKEEEEWLSREIFEDFDEFCMGFERFWWYYNYKRPHSSLESYSKFCVKVAKHFSIL
ncbi:MAG TPA: transposase, partial [Thermotoga sp.]|nr:transposase [Thermotoga sp.]